MGSAGRLAGLVTVVERPDQMLPNIEYVSTLASLMLTHPRLKRNDILLGDAGSRSSDISLIGGLDVTLQGLIPGTTAALRRP